MSKAVHEILQSIQHLPEADRLILEEHHAQLAEAEWKRAVQEARQNGIDQTAIDGAVDKVRCRR